MSYLKFAFKFSANKNIFAFNHHALCFLEQVHNQLHGWINAFCQGTVMQKYPTVIGKDTLQKLSKWLALSRSKLGFNANLTFCEKTISEEILRQTALTGSNQITENICHQFLQYYVPLKQWELLLNSVRSKSATPENKMSMFVSGAIKLHLLLSP